MKAQCQDLNRILIIRVVEKSNNFSLRTNSINMTMTYNNIGKVLTPKAMGGGVEFPSLPLVFVICSLNG